MNSWWENQLVQITYCIRALISHEASLVSQHLPYSPRLHDAWKDTLSAAASGSLLVYSPSCNQIPESS